MYWRSDDPELQAIQDELLMGSLVDAGLLRKSGTHGVYQRTDKTEIDHEGSQRRDSERRREMMMRCFERSCGRPMLTAKDFHEWARSPEGERYMRAIMFNEEWMLNP